MNDDSHQNHTSKKRKITFQIIYIIAVILWILVLYALKVYTHSSPVGYFILSIPIFVYAIGFLSVGKITTETQTQMLKTDVLPIALLFLATILCNTQRDSHYTINIMVIATLLVLLSLIDIWTSSKSLRMVQIIKSIFQTAAITLLIYVFYIRFTEGLVLVRQGI